MTPRPLALLCLLTATAAAAADRTFPYEGTVRAAEVEVRSGPGSAYYTTGLLKAGDRVTVMRHDRGGWYMVKPPAGSFSYVRADHVQTADGQTGVVSLPPSSDGLPARTVVRIGSQVSDDAAFSGRQLPNGERVTILGRKTVETDAGPVEMFRIEPPEREFRWVKGDYVVEAKGDRPTGLAKPIEESAFEGDLVAEFGTPADDRPPLTGDADPNVIVAQRKRLEAIDARFRAMAQQEPPAWRLGELEADYAALRKDAATEMLVGQIGQRLAAIESRRKVLKQYEDFLALINRTSDQERKLLSLQTAAGVKPDVRNASLADPAATPAEMPPLDGAGLVQKVTARVPNGPRYVLLAPDGRTLAYLIAADGVSIEEHVGKQRGVVGDRRRSETLGGDVIRVRRLVPVELEN